MCRYLVIFTFVNLTTQSDSTFLCILKYRSYIGLFYLILIVVFCKGRSTQRKAVVSRYYYSVFMYVINMFIDKLLCLTILNKVLYKSDVY